jgi:hypothetical protein
MINGNLGRIHGYYIRFDSREKSLWNFGPASDSLFNFTTNCGHLDGNHRHLTIASRDIQTSQPRRQSIMTHSNTRKTLALLPTVDVK